MQLNKNRILDGGRWRPPSRLVIVEGEERVEKLSGLRTERWLNPAGAVVALPLGNANVVAEEGLVPYAEQIRNRKRQAGWIPWGRCPVAMAASQEIGQRVLVAKELIREHACMSREFGPSNPCPHALKEQAARELKHRTKEDARAEAHKKEIEREREQREAHHRETIEAMNRTAERTAAALERAAKESPRK